jgi:feruloyl esterase
LSLRGLAAALGVAALAGAPAGLAHAGTSRAAEGRCAKLASVRHLGLQILSATRVPEGRFAAAPDDGWPVPASCRVVVLARPVPDSEIGFELWLPDGWNGRYSQLGNGGFAGNIDHPSLANEIRHGNAAAMTDTGHKASQFDASWAFRHPAKLIDYGYRSIKVTADAAKALIGDYYGRAARRRYFIGCSNGGRQALMAAQRYPDDWDGVLAGSPPVQWTKQLATFAVLQQRLRSSPENWIPESKLPLIRRAAIAACSAKQAAVDACRIDVGRLECGGRDAADCLTDPQVRTLQLILTGPRDVRGRPLFYGFEPISAAIPGNWKTWILNPDRSAPSDLAFATQAYRYFVLDRPDWQVEEFKLRRDFPLASKRKVGGQSLSDILNPDDPDLSRFAKQGGKLIIYAGWADALISPEAAADYYRDVMRRMGGERTERFARLFVIPGMEHCQGGFGPNAFGQAWVAPAFRADADHDIRLALEAWVERGLAPASLAAVRYAHDNGSNRALATQRLRPFPAPADPLTPVDP